MNITIKEQDGTSHRLATTDPRYSIATASIRNAKQLLLHFYLRSLFIAFAVLSGLAAAGTHSPVLFIAAVLFAGIAVRSGVRYQQARRKVPVLANAMRGYSR